MTNIKFGSGEDDDGNQLVDKTFESDIGVVAGVIAFDGPTFCSKTNRRYTSLTKSECFDKLCAAVDAYNAAHKAWVACYGGKKEKRNWGIEV